MSDWRQMDLEELTSSLEDTPASPSVQPGNEEARKMAVTSGQKLKGSWLPSGPLGVCLRTLLDTSAWASTKCFLTWKAKDTPRGRQLFQLAPSMPRTDETGSGLWLGTPTAAMSEGSEEFQKGSAPTPAEFVKMWPTPAATDHKGSGKTGEFRDRLDYAVERGATKTHTYEKPQQSGQLNPTWVEWLMGFPEGWTDLER